MTGPFLPYGRPSIDDDDVAAVATALRDDLLTTGPRVEAFESRLAERVGASEAVVCASGTAALHLAMLALDLGPGDAAIVPTVTFVATANAVRLTGAEVVFADVDAETGLMTADHLDEALARAGTLRPKAVVPVHLAGQCHHPAGLRARANRHGLAIVEDACHALGTRYGNGVAIGGGRHADMACFSFHPVKTITMGEGGAVTLNDAPRARRLRRLRSHGIDRQSAPKGDPWRRIMTEPGLNYRASDVACALGLSQLAKLDRFIARRAALVARYEAALASSIPLVRPLGRAASCRPGWHLAVVLVDFRAAGLDRATVMARLQADGVGTQVHFPPVHEQPYYSERYGALDLPGARRYHERALTLPLFPAMTDHDVDRVVAALGSALGPRP
ncbi:MAG: UDP-4-amino-4,6-dideoxy-N-acetyl-beta-L-altrosamine transaminase [Alphaproteobacteria bacterium]